MSVEFEGGGQGHNSKVDLKMAVCSPHQGQQACTTQNLPTASYMWGCGKTVSEWVCRAMGRPLCNLIGVVLVPVLLVDKPPLHVGTMGSPHKVPSILFSHLWQTSNSWPGGGGPLHIKRKSLCT